MKKQESEIEFWVVKAEFWKEAAEFWEKRYKTCNACLKDLEKEKEKWKKKKEQKVIWWKWQGD